jgi:hypothetical protein
MHLKTFFLFEYTAQSLLIVSIKATQNANLHSENKVSSKILCVLSSRWRKKTKCSSRGSAFKRQSQLGSDGLFERVSNNTFEVSSTLRGMLLPVLLYICDAEDKAEDERSESKTVSFIKYRIEN